MENKVILFDKNVNRYRKFAEACADKEDFFGTLRYLTSAKSLAPDNLDVIMDLADAYADMGLLEVSNRYWFKYIDKAPKERVAVAYEEIAINFFYMDNFWASSYYFHQKLATDGFISKEGLSQDIIDFFSGEEHKKGSYKIAYPFDKADYSYDIKKAKHAIAIGAFEEGAKILSNIPKECMDEEAFGDLAVCYFMSDDLDASENASRDSLKIHGENVTAFCNLSTVYDMREDFDNSDFYYKKALSCRKGEKGEAYKIATCAIEREDHITVCDCLKTILNERPYEQSMRFFYGLCLANLKNYQAAAEQLKIAHSLDPEDFTVEFYFNYISKMSESGTDEENLTPFKYVKEIPEEIAKKWKGKIRALVKSPEKAFSALKKKEIKQILEWGIYSVDSEFMRDCVYLLTSPFTPYSKEVVLKALLNPEGREELKRVLVYVLICSSIKEKAGIVAGNFYCKLKPKKLACEKDAVYGGLYLSAYALCVSKMIFFDIEGVDKLAKECDKIYKKLRGKVTEAETTNEEIAALILSQSKLKKYSEDVSVLRIFSITKNKLKMLKQLLKGENDG